MSAAVTLRRATDEDREFLYRVYAGTREEELRVVPWTAAQKEGFLRMQFHAQDVHYAAEYPQTERSVILVDGVPMGRLYVDRREDEISVIDIALLPEARGGGVGAGLMRAVLDEAAARGVPVRIHVERNNPAQRLYGRLGFRAVREEGIYLLLEWSPAPPSTST